LTEGTAVSKDLDSTGTTGNTQQETASNGTEAEAGNSGALTKPFKIRKRIGFTAYEVEVRFNPASRETFDEKILRLIRGETGAE
jgi:hypothetical protein